MLDKTTTDLFQRYPREVGNPNRYPIQTVHDLEHFIKSNSNHTDQIFISLYPSNTIINNLFFDVDYGEEVFSDFVRLFEHAEKNNLNPIPIITGLKGTRPDPRYHLYLRLKPHIYGLDAKILLYKSQMKILTDVFGDFDKVMVDKREKLKTKERYLAIDPTCIGDTKRLVRIPQTPRMSTPKTFCTYLPLNFPTMTPRELLEHCKTLHNYDYPKPDKTLLLTDKFFDFDLQEKTVKNLDPNPTFTGVPKCLKLKSVLRPCVYNSINHIHPSYTLRQIATIDLYSIGFTEEQIVQLFSELGWEDFNEDITRDKVNYYCKGFREGHKPYSCSKLKELGIPKNCCTG